MLVRNRAELQLFVDDTPARGSVGENLTGFGDMGGLIAPIAVLLRG